MKWTEDVTFTCGHTKSVTLRGKESYIKWKLEQLKQEDCQDCIDEAQRRKNLEVAAQNKADGLPELRGSEKQILWAESIRKETLEKLENMIEKRVTKLEDMKRKAKDLQEEKKEISSIVLGRIVRLPKEIEALEEAVKDFSSEVSASRLIDRRDDVRYESMLIERYARRLEEKKNIESKTFSPEGGDNGIVVDITTGVDGVEVYCSDDSGFKHIMRRVEAKWKFSHWLIKPSFHWHGEKNIMAWTASQVLAEGYKVRTKDPDVIKLIETDSFKPYFEKVIVPSRKYGNMLILVNSPDEAIKNLEKLRGAFRSDWRRDYFFIPAYYTDIIREYADIYGYHISHAAERKLEEIESSKAEKIAPKVVEQESGSIKDILSSSTEVIDDLKDED